MRFFRQSLMGLFLLALTLGLLAMAGNQVVSAAKEHVIASPFARRRGNGFLPST